MHCVWSNGGPCKKKETQNYLIFVLPAQVMFDWSTTTTTPHPKPTNLFLHVEWLSLVLGNLGERNRNNSTLSNNSSVNYYMFS